MSLTLCGLGTALPRFGIAQPEAARLAGDLCSNAAEHQRSLAALYRRTGVEWRHSVVLDADSGPIDGRQSFYPPPTGDSDRGPTTAQRMDRYAREAGDLAANAARKALADAQRPAQEITHLITVSCSGFSAPGFDVTLVRDLSLRADVARTHIGFMGCHGALNALRVARGFTAVDPKACVLICCVELCSLHHQYGWEPDQVVANALFADGAAAVVACASEATERTAWRVVDNGSTIVPDTTDAMAWRIGDHGFEMTLSPAVPELIRRYLRPWLAGWLSSRETSLGEICSWAIHPGGPRILQACAAGLEFPQEYLAESVSVLSEFGNMSSPTVLFILDRLRRRDAPSPCVLLGFGPGLTIEAALLRR